MAETIPTYNPCEDFCPPAGRIAVLGKARAAIDKVRSGVNVDLAGIAIQVAAQKDSHYKIYAEVYAMEQQTEQMILKTTQEITASIEGLNQSDRKITSDIELGEQKTTSETRLLDQKAITELAQTADALPAGHPGMNLSTDVSGVVAKQKNLFQKQTDGFDRDAEQKLAKIMVDTWSVRQTTDGEVSSTAGVDNTEVDRVLQKAKTGINY